MNIYVFILQVVSLESMYVPSDLGQSECHHQGSESFCSSCFYNGKPKRVDWALEEKFGTKPSAWFRCAIQVGYIRAFETKGLQFITEVKMETLHIRGLEVEVSMKKSVIVKNIRRKKLQHIISVILLA